MSPVYQDMEVVSGKLVCMMGCGNTYPIIRSIPRFVPESNYTNSFGIEWNLYRTTQLDCYNGTTISHDRFFCETGWSAEELTGKLVLDAGCGAGRFSDICLRAGAEVIAVDMSDAVDACWQNLSNEPRIHVIQSDLFHPPFRNCIFDFVFSLGVIQHTPDPDILIHILSSLLKPRGKIALWIYEKRLQSLLTPKYLLRPITTRMPQQTLLKVINVLVPIMLPLSYFCRMIPLIGRYIQKLVPVANYRGIYPLNNTQILEWALLDTYDWFSPTYDQPMTFTEVVKALSAGNINQIQRTTPLRRGMGISGVKKG